MSEMKVVFCGSQTWTDRDAIRAGLETAYEIGKLQHGVEKASDLTVVHGDAIGADTIAGEIAEELGHTVIPVPADFKTYGKAAGRIRNKQMIDMDPQVVFAYMTFGGSPSTQNTINQAVARNIQIVTRLA